ncbi:uncharacterized protein CPUR_00221 [Claviceps purpurea 20.1]|uniref:Presequence translocated-associated motor subunit PAM17 n=1 Tax=Claviceps purpurea (strain 20.1) TaxID=1111077 RepID=M1VTW9_CLAP2|nr:hypothetical protein E4U28_008189 [Claviceps purpurea]CCE26752.1 uncharacterized protein CPUR_00221 [Claviceps purpurea 20.1]
MSSSLTALALRLPRPSHTAAVTRCCSKTSMSTIITASAAATRPACIARATASPLRNRIEAKSVRNCSSSSSSSSSSGLVRSSKPMTRCVSFANTTFPLSITSQARTFATGSTFHSPAAAELDARLDWDTFFKLRLRRRRLQLFFSLTAGVLGGGAGAVFLSTGLAEPLVMQVPLDPFVSLGLMTMACGGLGWLVGPSIGNQAFYLMNRRLKTQMMQKESEFFARVKKNRANPANSSASNPVPDYYGEKIQSVAGYRRWLQDQRAFNRKKTRAFV